MRNNALAKGKRKGKKAMGMGFIVALILALVVLVILIAFIYFYNSQSEYAIRKERCKESVKLQAFTASRSINIAEKLDCPTEHILINSEDDNALKRAMANQMYDCWDKMGHRELQLWDDRSEHFCIVCSVIEFGNKEKKLEQFPEYLMSHRPAGKQKTYFEMIYGADMTVEQYAELKKTATKTEAKAGVDADPNPQIETNVQMPDNAMDTSKKYAVIYSFMTDEYINKMEGGAIGVAGGAAGAVLAISYFIPGVNVVTISITAAITITGFFIGYSVIGDAHWQSYVAVTEYSPDAMKVFACDEISAPVAVRGKPPVTVID